MAARSPFKSFSKQPARDWREMDASTPVIRLGSEGLVLLFWSQKVVGSVTARERMVDV